MSCIAHQTQSGSAIARRFRPSFGCRLSRQCLGDCPSTNRKQKVKSTVASNAAHRLCHPSFVQVHEGGGVQKSKRRARCGSPSRFSPKSILKNFFQNSPHGVRSVPIVRGWGGRLVCSLISWVPAFGWFRRRCERCVHWDRFSETDIGYCGMSVEKMRHYTHAHSKCLFFRRKWFWR